jgi:hypothetical protein
MLVLLDDWWLFDDKQVAFNLVDDEGRPAGAALTTDADIVELCGNIKARLWQRSIPFRQYITSAAANT